MLLQYTKKTPEQKLRRLVREMIQQGPHHYTNLRRIFVIIREEWAAEFYEDNTITRSVDICEAFVLSEGEPLDV